MTITQEQINAVKAVYPTLTDAQIMESLEKAEKAKAKRRAKVGEVKGATAVVGAPTAVAAAVACAPTAVAKLSHADFTIRAIRKLRKPPFKGIHARYSGFNHAFASYFGLTADGKDNTAEVVRLVQAVVASGAVDGRPCKGGYMLYEKGQAPASTHTDALDAILAD